MLLPQREFSQSNYSAFFVPRTLSIHLDITYDNLCESIDDGNPGISAYYSWYEIVHFWQVSSTNHGIINSEHALLRQQIIHEIVAEQTKNNPPKLPIAVVTQDRQMQSLLEQIDAVIACFAELDGYEITTVVANNTVPHLQDGSGDNENSLPCFIVPLVNSTLALKIPIGVRAIMEGAAEIVSRSCLPQESIAHRFMELQPNTIAAFKEGSTHWHYSVAETLFKTIVLPNRKWSNEEAGALILDLIDYSFTIPPLEKNTHKFSPGHRYVHLIKTAAVHAPATFPYNGYHDFLKSIITLAGFPSHHKVITEILSRKERVMLNDEAFIGSPLPLMLTQIYSNFKDAAKIRKKNPTAFGSSLLIQRWRQVLFNLLPPPLIHLQTCLRIPGPRYGDIDQITESVPVSNFILNSILSQAQASDKIICPFKKAGVNYNCGCEYEKIESEPAIPTKKGTNKKCAFLSVWKKLGHISGNLKEIPIDF